MADRADGVWQLERQCGDCGTNTRVGQPRVQRPPQLGIGPAPGPNCTGYYNGRPKNKCGWPTSFAWVFYPTEKLL